MNRSMAPLQQARAHLALLHEALDEGDFERGHFLVDQAGDGLDLLARERRPHVGDHLCVTCESTCDTVTELKRAVRVLQQENQALAWALVHSRELTDVAKAEIDRKFPEEEAA